MKIRIYETIIECVEVEVEDGLDEYALEAAIEHEREHTRKSRQFVQVESVIWEPME